MVCFLQSLMVISKVLCCALPYLVDLFILGGFSVFAGVGERTREGNDLYREMIESGVIKLGDKQVNKSHFKYDISIYFLFNEISPYKVVFSFGRVRASVLLSTGK